MPRSSEKKHWEKFWSSSPGLEDVYANDGRVVAFLAARIDLGGKRVLEVGAGTGRDSVELAARGAEVWTLDYSEQALRIMREASGADAARAEAGEHTHPADNIRIVSGDARALPFRDDSFDVVFHQGLLEHFRDPLSVLRENQRVLRRGGHLLVDVPQRYHYYTLVKHALMAVDKWFAGWETEFSSGELSALMREAGFEIEGAYGENLFPPVWYRGVRRVLLRTGVRLPMHPAPALVRAREAARAAVPLRVRLATSMVIGCLGRKR
jgi:ubiquinone/menaquinone biosynthesis C-methylase UbiE